MAERATELDRGNMGLLRKLADFSRLNAGTVPSTRAKSYLDDVVSSIQPSKPLVSAAVQARALVLSSHASHLMHDGSCTNILVKYLYILFFNMLFYL